MRTDRQLDQALDQLAEFVKPPESVLDQVMQRIETERLPTRQPSARRVPDVPTDGNQTFCQESECDGAARAALEHTEPPHRRHIRRRFRHMFEGKSLRWTVGAVAAGLAISVVGLWPNPAKRGSSNGIAWAQVVESIGSFRPYCCTITWEYERQVPVSYREMRLSLSRRREVFPGGLVRIFDLSTTPNLILELRPNDNIARQKVLLETGPRQDPDWLRIAASTHNVGIEDLGSKEVEGRLAFGFHRPDKINDMTIWADAKTGLPIRIEVVQPEPARRLILSEFEFDMQVDESLFDASTAPAGYQLQTMEVDGINPEECHLIEGLREVATFLGGEFPSRLDKVGIQDALAVRARSIQPAPSEPEMKKLNTKAARVSRFIEILGFKGAHVTYTGQSVKLGDSSRVILSWTSKASPIPHVIYGDLTAANRRPDEIAR